MACVLTEERPAHTPQHNTKQLTTLFRYPTRLDMSKYIEKPSTDTADPSSSSSDPSAASGGGGGGGRKRGGKGKGKKGGGQDGGDDASSSSSSSSAALYELAGVVIHQVS